MVLDIGQNVFMVRMGTGEFWDVRVLKRIVPANLLAGLIDLVTVVQNSTGVEINQFPDIQDNSTIKMELPLQPAEFWANVCQNER